MNEHRAVGFRQDVWTDLDRQIWPDSDDVGIERRMVQFAESEAIRDDGIAARPSIRDDVRRVKQLIVSETTY